MHRSSTLLSTLAVLLAAAALLVAFAGRGERAEISRAAARNERRVVEFEAEIAKLRSELAGAQSMLAVPVPGEGRESAASQNPAASEIDASGLARRLASLERVVEVALATGLEGGADAGVAASSLAREALEEARNDEMRGQLERWVVREEKKTQERLASAGNRLTLTWSQNDELARIFADEKQAQLDLIAELWRQPAKENAGKEARSAEENWKAAIERMKQLRQERDEKLARVLSAEQLSEFRGIAGEGGAPASKSQPR
ncbi:MAG: hypothetical protein L0Z55_04835 [Planctomycetes bacterium]|nr:hypothetical protein [Planctomycetota bacterium]